jgi:hypothetical protein
MLKNKIKLIFLTLLSLQTFGQNWSFTNSNEIWESSGTASILTTSSTYSVLTLNAAGTPQIRTETAGINTVNIKVAIIKIKNHTSNTRMQVIYNTGTDWASLTNETTNVDISANDSEIKTYVVKLDNDAAWVGTQDRVIIRFKSVDEDGDNQDAVDDGLGKIYFYDITMSKYKWSFDAASSDWVKDNSVSFVYNGTTATLPLKTDNNTSYSGIKTSVGVIGNDYRYVVVRLQNSSDRVKLRVRFNKDGGGNGFKTIDITTNDTGFKTYYFDMSSDEWDTNSSKDDIRILVGTNTSNAGEVIFDDVQFVSSAKDASELTFDGNADYETLSATNGSSVEDEDGYITYTTDGDNNNAKLSANTSDFHYTYDADTYQLVTVNLINVSSNNQLMFSTQDSDGSNMSFTNVTMTTNDLDDPDGTPQILQFNVTKSNWSGASNNRWFLRSRNTSNSNIVESGKIYIKSIVFSDNTTPVETVVNGDWNAVGTWWQGLEPTFKQTVQINHSVTTGYENVRSVNIASDASLIATGGFTGNVTYNRNLATTNWYLVSSPVAGETYDNTYVTDNGIALGADNNRGIASYTTSDDSWDYMQSGETTTFSAGTGYSVKRSSAGDISFTGTLNHADAGVDVVLDATGKGFNLLGNPYTSHIASAIFLNDNSAVLENKTLWVWDLGTDAYEVKTLGDAMVIAPAQGFFVKANGTGGTFNFAESNQAGSGGTFQRTESRPEIYLTLSDQTDARIVKIYYIENMTTGFDVGYEGELFNGVSNPLAIYTHLIADSQGKNYQVQSLPPNNFENMIIPVGVNANAGTSITIDASTNNFPEGMNIYLEDKQDNSFTLLEADANFSTTLENSLSGIGRFYLHTTSTSLSVNDLTTSNNLSIYNTNRENLRIAGVQNGTATIQLYNILGKEVLRTSFEGKGVNDITLPNLANGVYIIKLAIENGIINKKIIIQ